MKLTIELTHVSEYETAAKTLLAFHAALSGQPVAEVTKPKKAKAPAPEPVDEEPDDSMAANPEPEVTAEEVAEEEIPYPTVAEKAQVEIPTQEQARDALSEYSVKNGMSAARELLAKYGAQRVSEVKDEERAAFIAEMVG